MLLKLTINAEWKNLWKLQTEVCNNNNEFCFVAWKPFYLAADSKRSRLVWLGRVVRMGQTRAAKKSEKSQTDTAEIWRFAGAECDELRDKSTYYMDKNEHLSQRRPKFLVDSSY
jgi:hypothetical protein